MKPTLFLLTICLVCSVTVLSQSKKKWDKTQTLNSISAYESYLSKFPNGQSTSIAVSNLQEIRYLNALKIKTVEAYEYILNLYPSEIRSEQLRKELVGLRKFEESKKLGEVALRMPPSGAISFSASPLGG